MQFVFSVTTLIPTNNAFVWWPAEFEVPLLENGQEPTEAQALQWINETLVEDGTVYCLKYELDRGDGGGRRVVKSKIPTVISKGMCGIITGLHIEFVTSPIGRAA